MTVDGTHSWVNSDPDTFCEVITNILAIDSVELTGEYDDLSGPQ